MLAGRSVWQVEFWPAEEKEARVRSVLRDVNFSAIPGLFSLRFLKPAKLVSTIRA
jgi:hypothetical protein